MRLQLFLYNVAIRSYFAFIWLIKPFHHKAFTFFNGRKETWNYLDSIPQKKPVIWFHCASLGEFEQAKPVIEELKLSHPHCLVVVSFFSPSGYTQAHKHKQTDYYFYLPMDSKNNASKLLQRLEPKVVVFVKYDLWYHYIKAVSKQNIPLYLLSAKIHTGGRWNSIFKPFTIKLMQHFTRIYCQDKSSFELLNQAKINNLSDIGDTRIDRVISIANQTYSNSVIDAFVGNNRCIIVGSSWQQEEAIMLKAYPNLNAKNIKVIIAPHEINRANEIKNKYPESACILYSQANTTSIENASILVLDTIGILAYTYRFANYAIVGGGFSNKLHNIYEASVYGIPVLFGPQNNKYPEAKTLIKEGLGWEITDEQTVTQLLNKIETETIKQKSMLFFKQNSGIVATFTKDLIQVIQ